MGEKTIAALLETTPDKVHTNLSPAKLVEIALERAEGTLAANEALVVHTGERTGRSPGDRYVVEEKWSKKNVWWGPVNKPIAPEVFEKILARPTD